MEAKAPGDVRIGIRIASAQEIAIVERECGLERRLGIRRPLQYLLPPIHPHVIVHVACESHLLHCRVPVRIVGLGPLKLILRVTMRAVIGAMMLQRFSSPLRNACKIVVVRLMLHEIHRQLATDDQFVEVGTPIIVGRVRFRDGKRDFERRYLPEVQVCRKERDAFGSRLPASFCVVGQILVDERLQTPLRLLGPTPEPAYGLDALVDRQLAEESWNIGNVGRLDFADPFGTSLPSMSWL